MTVKTNESTVLACVWFSAAFALCALAVHSAINGALTITPCLLGLAVIHVYVARQRLLKYQLPEVQYNKTIRMLAIFVVIMAGAAASYY
ncbi:MULTISPECIES: hypothetical protein [unclassified Shewanella]|uniref:hypothetical protein n=1 Tax=unclassified Shewanella TaxID=196818 RepID=UPI000C79B19E|nr:MULTISPECIES: hypothetical protein [unclassified Shewanella]PKG55473.1 hypothetical protein CXF82_19695 [Shewanella sp. GutDb-MelDb]PKG75371.1 hypothetical protein CXF86_07590 [Shewanella sp. GutCb]